MSDYNASPDIAQIVQRVVQRLSENSGQASSAATPKPSGHRRGIFSSVEEAMKATKVAQEKFCKTSLATRKDMVAAMREVSKQEAQRLAELTVQETKMGRVDDKVKKNLLVAEKTPGVELLPCGAEMGDNGLTVEEYSPFGIILSVSPTTNPNATVINNSISMISAGNSVFFAPHPRALQTTLETIHILNGAIERAGGPANLIVATDSASIEHTKGLMRHPDISLICATGGPALVNEALSAGKRAIGAAAGNPPALVDDTADAERAAREIILGHSFDNNLPCTSEKEVIMTSGIADALMRAFRNAPNTYMVEPSLLPKLEALVLNENRNGPNPKCVGQDPCVILRELGIDVGQDIRAIIAEVDADHPFIHNELLMPVLGVTRVRDFKDAVRLAVEAEHGLRHSAIIHSSNIYNMSEFNHAINATLFIKNAPSYAGLGYGAEGHTSFTIAGRTGEGMTNTRTFVRSRRCILVGAFSAV